MDEKKGILTLRNILHPCISSIQPPDLRSPLKHGEPPRESHAEQQAPQPHQRTRPKKDPKEPQAEHDLDRRLEESEDRATMNDYGVDIGGDDSVNAASQI